MQPPYQAPYYAKPPVAEGSRKGLAIASMIFGIVSFFTLGGLLIGPLVGAVLGIIALRRTSREPAVYGGRGFAIAGIFVSLGSLIIPGLIAAIAIPNLLAARRAANTASALESMRLIHSTEATYSAGTGNGEYATAEELFKNDFIDPVLASAMGVSAITSLGGQRCLGNGNPKSGYKFMITSITKPTSQDYAKFTAVAIVADPKGIARTGNMNLFIDESGVIRVSNNLSVVPDAYSPPLSESTNFDWSDLD
ncbi:MAG: DUF4190 domain-containing protein [Acidobacteriota bacterium]